MLQNSTRGLGHESCGGRKEGVSGTVIEPSGWSTYGQGPKSSTETADEDQSVWAKRVSLLEGKTMGDLSSLYGGVGRRVDGCK